MKFLIRYWYLIVLAFALSLVSAVVMLYLERDEWIAQDKPMVGESSELPGMSKSYMRWNYQIAAVEDLRISMEAKLANLDSREERLQLKEQQVESEMADLLEMRDELEALRDQINQDVIRIEASEQENIKRLAKVYEVMKSDAAVEIFRGLELELVVKIMSEMGDEPASRILAEMSSGGTDSNDAKRAMQITEIIQNVEQ